MAGTLPVQPTPFVGRREEIETLVTLLASPDCRLLTLLGPGGIGKTRLSLEVAARLGDAYADGAHPVELDAVADPALVARTVASALDVRDRPEQSPLERLSATLGQQELLLILDNCEHLVEACAELAHTLLTTCPGLSILATSREPLHTAGEVIWEVPPLSVPALEGFHEPQDLEEVDAVALFVERARRAVPTFALDTQTAPLVARLCNRLDGLPLALELAAARIRALSVAQILERLDDALGLLAGGDRLAPARQQTLRATLDWSYDLLGSGEQRLFERLSVFAGGFSLEAAEEICCGDGLDQDEVLDLLSGLVDRSLVVAGGNPGTTRRYRLLDTIRAYAGERLAERGTAEAWRNRHLHWYLRFAEQADEPASWGIGDAQTLESLDSEGDNLRGAMSWAIDNSKPEEGHRFAAALAWFWFRRGHVHEGRHWLDQILALPGVKETAARAYALSAAGTLAWLQGDSQRAIALHKETVALGRDPRCSAPAAWSMQRLAYYAEYDGDAKQADDWLAQSLELFHKIGNQSGVAYSRLFQGYVAWYRGDHLRAEDLFRVSLQSLREIGDTPGIVMALHQLSAEVRQRGELQEARAHLHDALRLAIEKGQRPGLSECLDELAHVASAQALPERAACLLGAADALRHAVGTELGFWHRPDHDQVVFDARTSLGDDAFETAFAAGQEMTLEQAVAFALEDADDGLGAEAKAEELSPLQAEKARYGGLTARERQVAALVAGGLSNRAIAQKLVVTLRTVEAHVTHILRKLGFDSRAQVAAWAVDRGLARAPETLDEQMRGSADG